MYLLESPKRGDSDEMPPYICFWAALKNKNNKYPVNLIFNYSEIPLLRPPKIKTFCQLKTLFAKFKLFVSSFSSPSVHLIRDHLWDCPKVVFKSSRTPTSRPSDLRQSNQTRPIVELEYCYKPQERPLQRHIYFSGNNRRVVVSLSYKPAIKVCCNRAFSGRWYCLGNTGLAAVSVVVCSNLRPAT